MKVRFLGALQQKRKDGSGMFWTHGFAIAEPDNPGKFSLASNAPMIPGTLSGSTFEIDGISLEPAMDAAGKPLMSTTQPNTPIFAAKRVSPDVDITLTYLHAAGFVVRGLPAEDGAVVPAPEAEKSVVDESGLPY